MRDDDLAMAAPAAYARSLLGDFEAARSVLAAAQSSQWIAAPAWAAVLRTTMAAAHPNLAQPTSLETLRDFADAPAFVRQVTALACVEHEKNAVLRFDPVALNHALALHAELVTEEASEAALWLQMGQCWARLFAGNVGGLSAIVARVGQAAASLKSAPIVVESSTLRALCAAYEGDLTEATRLARRASRMARTEAIVQQEYLANLVLSRVRRMTGHPHLATRILGALLHAASPRFADWLRWELLMAGALELGRPPEEPPTSNASAAVAALARLISGAEAGDRPSFEQAAAQLETTLDAFCLLRDEARTVRAAIDLVVDPTEAVRSWCAGQTRDPPAALQGLCTRTRGAAPEESAIAFVVAAPDGRRRRVLRLGLAMVALPGLIVLRQGRRKQGRTETLIATLGLAGPDGMPEELCFREVYEFEYEVETHKGVFDVLAHRARDYVAEAGAIERGSGTIRLVLNRPLSVPDPRCAQPLQDRLLRALARSGASTAKELASAAGVSLRTAQAALQELATDGMCLVQREGRKISYAVEDTTFREPTVHRAAGLPTE